MTRRLIMAMVFIVLLLPAAGSTAASAEHRTQAAGTAPATIQIPQALVDTTIEPLEIVDGVPGITSNPWTVGWYQGTGRLGVPGNAVMFGQLDWWDVGPSVFFLADQLQPGDRIDVTGEDGTVYGYEVEWTDVFPRETAPIAEIFTVPTDEQLVTLFVNADPFDPVTGTYANTLVVRATRTADDPSPAPETQPATLTEPDGCPVAPATLALPQASQPYPYPVVDAVPSDYPDRQALGIPAATDVAPESVAAIDTLLGEVTPCDVVVRQALLLPDGYVFALVGPAGILPLEAMSGVVLPDARSVTDPTLANLFAFMLFVEEEDGWRLLPPTQ